MMVVIGAMIYEIFLYYNLKSINLCSMFKYQKL